MSDTASTVLTSPAQTTAKSGFRKWLPLLIMSLAFTIIILDTTILNVSLRAIIVDLHTTIQNLQWVITAYSLTLAALTVTGGRLGDIFGRKKMFIVGAIIFAIGSFITSISTSVGMMIAGEAVIEGIGAALMVPATSSLLVANYKGRERQLAMGVWGGIAGGAAALGPVVGGWLTTSFSWRWAFAINVFVAALLVFGAMYLQESQDREEKPTLDYVGIVLSALGLLSLVFGFIEASTYGWFWEASPFVIGGTVISIGGLSVAPIFMAIGVIIIGLFLYWEYLYQKAGKAPLVSLSLFKNSQFTVAVSITLILALGQAGMSFTIPVFLQSVLGIDPLRTGVTMLPMSLTMLVVAPLSAYIAKYFTPKRIIQAGLLIDAVAFYALSAGVSVNASQWSLAPGFALFGLGMGLMMAQTSNMALSAVSVEEAGEVSGVNSTLRQVGATLGSAVIGALLLSTLTTNLVNGVQASTVIPENLKPAITETVTTQTSNIEFGSGLETGGQNIPDTIRAEIATISKGATVAGNKTSLLFGVIVALIAFAVSFKLPNTKNVERGRSLAAGH